MRVLALAVCVLGVLARAAYGQSDIEGDLPDVIIGDPYQAENDILGPPIAEKEIKAGLALNVTVPDDDPISASGYFQGDIMIESRDHLTQILQGDPSGQHSAVSNEELLWPKGAIAYVISSSFSSKERQVIARAMAEISRQTCLTFPPRTNQTDYVHFLKGKGCASSVGKVGGMQTLSLGNNCVHIGIVMHELLHAAGFWHEQSRYDRDDYVTIMWQNIIRKRRKNFDKKSNTVSTDLGVGYDYGSIMHYGRNAFSLGTGPTIIPNRSGVVIGQRTGLSQLNVKGVNRLYRCSGPGPQPIRAPLLSACKDNIVHCVAWAKDGHCSSNSFTRSNCRKSCNACGSTDCRDEAQHCSDWASKGECQRYPQFMKEKCRLSCNMCAASNPSGTSTACQDEDVNCSMWATKGECSRNPDFMKVMCRKSCVVC